MQNVLDNRLHTHLTDVSNQLQLDQCFRTELWMDGGSLDCHGLILTTRFCVSRTIAKEHAVQLEQGTALRPARLTNTPVQQFRDGCLGNADCHGHLALRHAVVKEVLND